MMTQDIPEDPDGDSEVAPAVPLEDADLTIDVVKVEAFLDALKQATPSEERVVPLIRKPLPRSEQGYRIWIFRPSNENIVRTT